MMLSHPAGPGARGGPNSSAQAGAQGQPPSRRSSSPLPSRGSSGGPDVMPARRQRQQQPRQAEQQSSAAQQQQQQKEEGELVGPHSDSKKPVPKHWRLPQPAKRRTVPEWVEDCFAKDEMARMIEQHSGTKFLHEGVAPEPGLKLYLQMTYAHDGSHPEHFRSWARMMGEVTRVYDPPEVGVYAVYEGQQQQLTQFELDQRRSRLPQLPPSIFGRNAACSCCRTAEQVVQQYGALHGQRIRARIWLSKMDECLSPQLGGIWDVELVANDNLESMWVMCCMRPAPDTDDPQQQHEEQQQQQGRLPDHQQQPDQQQHRETGAGKGQQPARQQQQQQRNQQPPQQPKAGADEGAAGESTNSDVTHRQRSRSTESEEQQRDWEQHQQHEGPGDRRAPMHHHHHQQQRGGDWERQQQPHPHQRHHQREADQQREWQRDRGWKRDRDWEHEGQRRPERGRGGGWEGGRDHERGHEPHSYDRGFKERKRSDSSGRSSH